MTPNELDIWFQTHILPLEGALTGYLRRVWPNGADIPDLRQDVYIRIYESAAQARPTQPKAFVFAVARNLVADRLRRARIVKIDYTEDFDPSNVLIDERTPEATLSSRQQLRRLTDALNRLPDQYRDVVWLMRVQGLSQKEAADRLGIPKGTLESRLHRSIKALANAVFGCDTVEERSDRTQGTDDEAELG